jgi:hypothetical protein
LSPCLLALARFDIVSNRHLDPNLKPKTSPALPSWEYSWHKAAAVDQTINMVNWNESKRLDDPSPVASRRAALSKLHIKERSSTLPVDIVSWTPKSPGSLAAGARQTAVAAGQSHAAPVAVAHHHQQRPMTGSAVRANMSRPSSSHGGSGSGSGGINLSIEATKIKFGPVHTGRPF